MKFLILGAGGINSYFGTNLICFGHGLNIVARGNALKHSKLKLQHPDFIFEKKFFSYSIDEIEKLIKIFLLTTKSTSTVILVNKQEELFTKVKTLSSDLNETTFLVRLIIIGNNIVSLAFNKLKLNIETILNKNLKAIF
ncbi:hypothetical protein [Aliarcobacter cibarius]|uniref:Ketopantoate reductase N-terminal domain-containing protein n=1 Tax=Aliarcobacter cibarius TaxID=255507 RepID=A0ABY2V2N1_9BACT|nr:hypothetical protein [Aliarcobacter cibarius]TLS97244.1 hypothetical protein FE247_08735 [Aliarcobacter cibarius]TLS97806.1 hypothetical protein FE245_08860 [Aliarcobacter cibarius]